MVPILFATGFEEIEALAPADILRRAGVEVKLVGVGESRITGSHGITVEMDMTIDQVDPDTVDALILPGGGVGTANLEASPAVQALIDHCVEKGKLVAAICAAPSILAHKGLLQGREAISFPTFQEHLTQGGAKLSEKSVVQDGNFLTAKGMGVATQFGLKLAEILVSKEVSDTVRASIQWEG